jgi:hypothetical protein
MMLGLDNRTTPQRSRPPRSLAVRDDGRLSPPSQELKGPRWPFPRSYRIHPHTPTSTARVVLTYRTYGEVNPMGHWLLKFVEQTLN